MENVLSQINGSPWAITEAALEDVRRFLRDPSLASDFGHTDDEDDDGFASRLVTKEGPLATMEIHGKILPRANMMTRMSGATSTAELTKAVKEVEEDEDVETLVMHVDSPGGSPTGLAGLTQEIRSMDTQTVAFAQGRMASAAYWIGSAADRVVASPMAKVGSIGVLALVTSKAEKLKDEGIETEVVRSTPLKASTHPAEHLDEESVKPVQEMVDRLHEEFVSEVAKNRNISLDQAKDMADGTLSVGSDAEEEGLTDDTMTLSELYSEFEFNEDSDLDRQEQQISFLEDTVGRLLDEKAAASARASELESEVERLRGQAESAIDTKIEAKLDEAIEEDKKFAPAKREELRSKIESDLEDRSDDVAFEDLQTVQMIDMVDANAAAPSGSVETPDEDKGSDQSKIDKLEAEGILVARHEDEVSIYEEAAGYEEGVDYVKAEKIGTGAYEHLL